MFFLGEAGSIAEFQPEGEGGIAEFSTDARLMHPCIIRCSTKTLCVKGLILIVFNLHTNITISNTTSSITRFPYFPYYTLYYLAQRLRIDVPKGSEKRQTDEVDMKKSYFYSLFAELVSISALFQYAKEISFTLVQNIS